MTPDAKRLLDRRKRHKRYNDLLKEGDDKKLKAYGDEAIAKIPSGAKGFNYVPGSWDL